MYNNDYIIKISVNLHLMKMRLELPSISLSIQISETAFQQQNIYFFNSKKLSLTYRKKLVFPREWNIFLGCFRVNQEKKIACNMYETSRFPFWGLKNKQKTCKVNPQKKRSLFYLKCSISSSLFISFFFSTSKDPC